MSRAAVLLGNLDTTQQLKVEGSQYLVMLDGQIGKADEIQRGELERQFRGQELTWLFQRTRVRFPEPTSGESQLLVT